MKSVLVRPLRVSRASAIYNVHSYHTKIPAAGITPYVEHYVDRGGLVLDPFAGSGMTGLAAALAGRRAILNDLSPAAVHIARNYTTPCDAATLRSAVGRLLAWAEPQILPLYESSCPTCGGLARTEYVVWSDDRLCPHCGAVTIVWDCMTTAGKVGRLECPSCKSEFDKTKASVSGERPVLVNLACQSCKAGRQDVSPRADDLRLCRVRRDQVPYWYPDIPFGPDWDMWRGGHRDLGVARVADFWSARNLTALAVLFEGIKREPDPRLRDALTWAFTAVVNRASRRYQWNSKRPTNVLGGTLYIASLRYEWNVLSLFLRKVRAVLAFYRDTSVPLGAVSVLQGSATDLSSIGSGTIDYCFTDPPFGANIYYSDASLLWEAWLGHLTDRSLEAVVSGKRAGKSVSDYTETMARSLAEIRRTLKPDALATLVFQNTDDEIWGAIRNAATDAGMHVIGATTLHKSQPSFKGVKGMQDGERVAATDVVMTLSPQPRARLAVTTSRDPEDVVLAAIQYDLETAGTNRTKEIGHLFAVAVSALVDAGMATEGLTFERVAELASRVATPPDSQLSLEMVGNEVP